MSILPRGSPTSACPRSRSTRDHAELAVTLETDNAAVCPDAIFAEAMRSFDEAAHARGAVGVQTLADDHSYRLLEEER